MSDNGLLGMKIIIPQHIPYKVLGEVGLNFFRQKICSESVRRKSALHLQSSLLEYISIECRDIIESFRNVEIDARNVKIEKIIWLMWWQGEPIENRIVSACVENIKRLPGFDVRVITKNNISEYIDISDILPIYESGHLYIQHLADIIRIRLLKEYGGFWLDAGIAVVDSSYLSMISDKYIFFTNKFTDFDDVDNVCGGRFSTYFWGTFKSNPLFEFVDDMMSRFVITHYGVIDYTQFDYSLMAGYQNIKFIHDLIDHVPPNNQYSWWLNTRLFDEFNPLEWEKITRDTHFFKLSAKRYNNCDLLPDGRTYWEYINRCLWKTQK